ncbi:plasmid pRiA4b ORF-3 family protein [Coraliomargarita sp. SDUM461004]|uniref:Plasmid pRiA4b ORF-3 family protein n=1 Tax=Thalassobacterium sedimentorum TaxID=3041258 RepID=A0ABU1APK3_9BACT|nr:plasmid pRiA4b ORF-3 family protein [Coraliomargarita sp. SDUM461004]MDQ8196158.1 plasmid pRiA4b ORF-3 family protein [Coraliomargarita sp. SDUM461004]
MSAHAANTRYLIRIQLEQVVRPPIWRELVVPANISLSWLHEVIQESMGWTDSHLHQYEQGRIYYIPSDYEDPLPGARDEAKVALSEVLKKEKDWFRYSYDFGDGWDHRITLKEILKYDEGDCLRCVKAKGGDVLEDCGGPHGLMEMRKIKQAIESGAASADWEAYENYKLEELDFENADLKFINRELGDIFSEAAERGGLHPVAAEETHGGGPFLELEEGHDLEDEDDGFEEFMSALAGGKIDLDDDDSDEFFDEDEAESETFPEPYTELPKGDLSEFSKTLKLAETVRAVEPWKQLWDRDIFAVEDPETRELDVVSVLGRGGEVYSIHVHRAPTALAFWRSAFSAATALDPESVLKMSSMVEVEFLNKAGMEAPDLKLYKYTRQLTPPRGRHRWIRFRSYRPRCFPWFSEAADMAVLRRGMRLALRYVELMQQSKHPESFLLSHLVPGTMPKSLKVFRLAAGAEPEGNEGWQLEDVSVDWERCHAEQAVYQPNEFECARLAKMPQQEDSWEVGTLCMPTGVMTASGPVMPVLAMACSIGTGNVPPKPQFTADVDISEAQTLWECLVANIDAHGYCPTEIRVVTDEAYEMLSPFAKLAGVRLAQFEEFAMLGQLFEMLAMMPGPDEM